MEMTKLKKIIKQARQDAERKYLLAILKITK